MAQCCFLFIIYYVPLLCQNVIRVKKMRQPSAFFRKNNPRAKANCISRLTFWYTVKIFNRAAKGDLGEDDLTQPLREHESERLGRKLAVEWSKQVETAGQKRRRPKLIKALLRCFKWDLISHSLIIIMLEFVIKISQPLFLKLILQYYSIDNMAKLERQEISPISHSYIMRLLYMYNKDEGGITKEEAIFYTSAMVLVSWLSIAISHPYLMGMMHLGMKMRIACCSLIYRKALRIKLEATSGNMVGNITNLLSNDVYRFDNGIMFLPYIVTTPIQMALIAFFVYMEVGFSAVYGILAMVLVLPVQLWLSVRVLFLRYQTALRTDERVREMNELIQAIQIIKMYTWEKVFINIISQNRRDEILYLRKMGFIRGTLLSFIIFSFRLSIFIMSVSLVSMTGKISAEKIFVTTAFLLILRQTVTVFLPQQLAQGSELLVSFYRMEEFLSLDEAVIGDPSPFNPNSKAQSNDRLTPHPEGGIVNISDASAKFGSDVVLENINVEVKKGLLTIVIGSVGSGKSCLLHLILGELVPFQGNIDVKGTISYASQEPWLFAGSIRQNILFGREFNRRRYKEVCMVCALETDFKLFPNGDRTFVGEKGTALSGGQRARVNLARAIYEDADIYLLDDPLSAVDTHVGKHLFQECINAYIADKIVVLVTHQLQYLESADQIVLLKNGVIESIGDYEALKRAGLDFSVLMAEQLQTTDDKVEKATLEERKSNVHKALEDVSRNSMGSVTFIDKDNAIPAEIKSSKESRTVGKVQCSTFKAYFTAGSNPFKIFLMFFLFVFTQLIASFVDYFLSKWTEMEEYRNHGEEVLLSTHGCISVYTGLVVATIIVSLLRAFYFYYFCMTASTVLHNNMFKSIVETRMNFFYNHSAGEILNRFSKDCGAMDELLPSAMIDTTQIFLNLLGAMLVLALVSPYFLIPIVLMCLLFYYMRNFYLKTGSNFKRLEGTTRSPLFAHINSTLRGLPTIRSNAAEQLLTKEFDRHQDINSSAWFIFIATSRAFGYCLDTICIVFIAIVSFAFLLMSSGSSAVGLAITQTIGLTGLFQWGIRQSAELENQMVSVERIIEYTRLESEPNLQSDPVLAPPPDWPTSGKIEFIHAYMKYGPADADVLMDVNFLIQDKEKVGVVGRTGAGKSSLIAGIFRLAYFYGEVRIDNLDVSQLCLHDLRRKISIIPQEPVLFKGTLQYNLDPYEEFDTDLMFNVLVDLENKDALTIGKACLKRMVVEGGTNVSIGQRQVICLARALLRNNRIIVMDEATANIDAQTDKFIQSVIRTKFSHCTVLTVAHRLHTIMDSDKVLVMDAGQVAEFDHPHVLLQQRDGIFAGMVEKTGTHMAESLKKIASETYKHRNVQSS